MAGLKWISIRGRRTSNFLCKHLKAAEKEQGTVQEAEEEKSPENSLAEISTSIFQSPLNQWSFCQRQAVADYCGGGHNDDSDFLVWYADFFWCVLRDSEGHDREIVFVSSDLRPSVS